MITREVVSKYYLWKRTTAFRDWRRRQTVKKCRKKKKEVERLRWGDESDVDPEAEAFLGYHNAQCELCATGGKLLCCDGCARAYHFSCVQPPITKLPTDDDEWFCPYCQEAFGGAKPKMVPSDDNEYCQVCLPFPGVPSTLMESMTDGSSQEVDDEQEGNSDDTSEDDAGSESNDEVVSDHDDNSSDIPSTQDLSSNAGNPGSLTDNESESTSAKTPPSFPGVDSSKSSKPEQKPRPMVESSAPRQQSGTVFQPSSGSLQVATNRPVERSAESSPARVRRSPSVRLERQGSGRKRRRKTMAPRRIPPSRFDSWS